MLYSFSTGQWNIWNLQKVYGEGIANIGGTLLYDGILDLNVFEDCIHQLIYRNESLRIEIENRDRQYIATYTEIPLEKWFFENAEEAEETFSNWMKEPFELENSPLYQFKLVVIKNGVSGGFMKLNHFVADAWTVSLICQQIINKYMHREINDNGKSYIEYIEQSKLYLNSDKFERDREYWNTMCSEAPVYCQIANYKGIEEKISTVSKRIKILLSKQETKEMIDTAKRSGFSINTIWIAALFVYLAGINQEEKAVIGVPALNRDIGYKNTCGMFVATLPLFLKLNKDMTFNQLAVEVMGAFRGIFKHSQYPFNNIMQTIKGKYHHINILYDVVVSYQNAKIDKCAKDGFRTNWYHNGKNETALTIHIEDRDDQEQLMFHLDYQTQRLNHEVVMQIFERLKYILHQWMEKPDIKVLELSLITLVEEKRIEKMQGMSLEKSPLCLHDYLLRFARCSSNKVAIYYGDNSMTYSELNNKSDNIAYLILEKGIKQESIISIMVERSFYMMILIFGILKAGCAYLPIAIDTPKERVKFVLKDSGSPLLFIQEKYFYDYATEIMVIENIEHSSFCKQELPMVSPEKLAYVIYTSGSTGEPKGVMIEHTSVINRLRWMNDQYPLNDNEILLQKTNYAFDVSVWELFWPIISGKSLYMLPQGYEKEPSKIVEAINKYCISKVHFVPSQLKSFFEYYNGRNNEICNSLKEVFASGEELTLSLVQKFYSVFPSEQVKLHNLYGPTECTVDVLFHECIPQDTEVPLGKPVYGTTAYIMDKYLRIMPFGVVGELCIGGIQLARGYVNSQQNFGRFTDNSSYGRLYRTGDLAYQDANGKIFYKGRNDFQVKLRGFRIELGEIEKRIMANPNVSNAVVKLEGEQLVGYYESDKGISAEEFVIDLEKHLPHYMIPRVFVRYSLFPINRNGKIDIKLISKEKGTIYICNKDYTPPSTSTEILITETIERIASITGLGVTDNFISRGIDSLTILRIITELEAMGVYLGIADFYDTPTIRSLVTRIETSEYKHLHIYQSSHSSGKLLLCIPYAGGSVSVYYPLVTLLSKKLDYTIAIVSSARENIEGIITELHTINCREIVLLGYCVGGGLAVELIDPLLKNGYNIINMVLAAITPPPFINPWHFLSNKQIVKTLGLLGKNNLKLTENEVLEFREDTDFYFSLMAKLKPIKFIGNILLIVGEKDLITSGIKERRGKKSIINLIPFFGRSWSYYFSCKILLRKIKGAKHFFLHTHTKEMSEILVDFLNSE